MMSEVIPDHNHLGNWQVLRLAIETGVQGKGRCRRAFPLLALNFPKSGRLPYVPWHLKKGEVLEHEGLRPGAGEVVPIPVGEQSSSHGAL